jgi:hypothetical protein
MDKFDEFKKAVENLTDNLETLEDSLETLVEVEQKLRHINDITGATERYENIKAEIELKGWETIERLYHPNNNPNDPVVVPMWEFYKFVKQSMEEEER